MGSFLYYIIYPILWILSRLPFPVVYLISDVVYFILYYIVGYRKEVVRKNLRIAFPDMDEKELIRIHKKNIAHFCDMFIEMIKSLGMSKKSMQKRFICENVDLVNQYADAGKPIIGMFGHQASYEWTMVLTDQMAFPIYAVYKQLRNEKFDALIQRIRMKFGAYMVPMKKANKKIQETVQEQNAIFALVADQSPKLSKSKYFTTFFDTKTAVYKGGERFGKQFNAVVFFLQVEKIKRGFYKSKYVLITENGADTEDHFITDTFFQLLEAQVRKQPEYYLWTHKRWKTIA